MMDFPAIVMLDFKGFDLVKVAGKMNFPNSLMVIDYGRIRKNHIKQT